MTVYFAVIVLGYLMVLVLKPISQNCGFAPLWMTNRKKVFHWLEWGPENIKSCLFLWVGSAVFSLLFLAGRTATDVPASLPCCEEFSRPITYCRSDCHCPGSHGGLWVLRRWLCNCSVPGRSPAGGRYYRSFQFYLHSFPVWPLISTIRIQTTYGRVFFCKPTLFLSLFG